MGKGGSRRKTGRRDARVPTRDARRGRTWSPPTALLLAVVAAAGVLVYLNSFDAVFVFDNNFQIVLNESIRSFDTALLRRRPLVDLSLAINYRLGELDVFGYHVVNIVIHALAALALFGLIHRTLRLEPMRERFGPAGRWIAFCVALIWVVHPLQTESVTYVIQRAESLMGLFYVLTLYCVLRGATAERGRWWFVAAVAACALGMGSKAVMVTAPVLVLLYDRIFLARSFAECLRRRGLVHLGIAATWIVLVVTGVAPAVLTTEAGNRSVGFSYKGVSAFEYLLSQSGVIVHYLRLSFWPHPLCLDYYWPVARTATAIVLPGIVLAAMLLATAWALWKHPRVGFVAASFFVVLAPTSSVVPVKDLAFEHRMYLSLAAVILLVVLGVHRLLRHLVARGVMDAGAATPLVVVLVAAITGALGWRTLERNRDYESDIVMWADVIAQRPDNPRARSNYGVHLLKLGRLDEAKEHFEVALSLNADDPVALNNIGMWLLSENRVEEAIESLVEAIRLRPYGGGKRNLANLLAREGNIDDTISRYRDRAPLDDVQVNAWVITGDLLLAEQRPADALAAYRRALTLDPSSAEARQRVDRLSQP